MGRPLGTKNVMRTPEEKEKIVLEYLNTRQSMAKLCSKHNIYMTNIKRWRKIYKKEGIEGLKSKTGKQKNSNPMFGKYNRHPSELEKLKRELLKKEIEVARLKKGYAVKGDGAEKEYITTFNVNMK